MSSFEDTERNERATRRKRSSIFTLTIGIIALVTISFLLLLGLVYFGVFAGSNSRPAIFTRSRASRPALSTRNNLIVFPDGNKLIGAYSTSNGIDGETIIQTTSVNIIGPVLSKDKKYVYYRDNANRAIIKVDVDRKSSKSLHPPDFPYESPQYSLSPDFVIDKNDSNKIFYGFVSSDNKHKIRSYDSVSKTFDDFDTLCPSNQQLYVKFQYYDGSRLYYGCGDITLSIYQKNLETNEVDQFVFHTLKNSQILPSRDGNFAITYEIGEDRVDISNFSNRTMKTKSLGFEIDFDSIKSFGFSEDMETMINIVKWEGRPIWKNCVRTIDFERIWNDQNGYISGPLAIRLLED